MFLLRLRLDLAILRWVVRQQHNLMVVENARISGTSSGLHWTPETWQVNNDHTLAFLQQKLAHGEERLKSR